MVYQCQWHSTPTNPMTTPNTSSLMTPECQKALPDEPFKPERALTGRFSHPNTFSENLSRKCKPLHSNTVRTTRNYMSKRSVRPSAIDPATKMSVRRRLQKSKTSSDSPILLACRRNLLHLARALVVGDLVVIVAGVDLILACNIPGAATSPLQGAISERDTFETSIFGVGSCKGGTRHFPVGNTRIGFYLCEGIIPAEW